MNNAVAIWPDLSYPAWRDTATTLQLWTQIVGKGRGELRTLSLEPQMVAHFYSRVMDLLNGIGVVVAQRAGRAHVRS